MSNILKKIVDFLNQPIGSNTKSSPKKRTKNLQLKTLELTYTDTIKNNKNIRYKYKVRDKVGDITAGNIEALSKADVHAFLTNQGYDVLEITSQEFYNKLGLNEIYNRPLRDKDLNFFLTQLSTCIKAGIPLIQAMEILSKQVKNKKIKEIYKRTVFELTSGKTFSEALTKQGKVFPKLLINMIKTSELTGNLTGVLDDMAEYYKTSDENRKQIISAMTYPLVILIIAFLVLVYIILYVVPTFTDMYNKMGSTLPPITIAIINISNYLANNLITVMLSIILVTSLSVFLYEKSKLIRQSLQWLVMHIPVIKKMIIYKEIIMFTKTFSSLLNYDVLITSSMQILEEITENEIYKTLINKAITNLKNGNKVSTSFKDHWAFPTIAYEMLQTGETTGHLGDMMGKVAEYYTNEQKTLITQFKSLVEPIMIVLLSIVVGIILLAVIVPMFNMYNSII